MVLLVSQVRRQSVTTRFVDWVVVNDHQQVIIMDYTQQLQKKILGNVVPHELNEEPECLTAE